MDPPGIEPALFKLKTGRHAIAVSSLWAMSPFLLSVDLMGVEPIAPILQGSVASIGMQAQLQRSARELNPVFRLTTAVCCRNTCRPFE